MVSVAIAFSHFIGKQFMPHEFPVYGKVVLQCYNSGTGDSCGHVAPSSEHATVDISLRHVYSAYVPDSAVYYDSFAMVAPIEPAKFLRELYAEE